MYKTCVHMHMVVRRPVFFSLSKLVETFGELAIILRRKRFVVFLASLNSVHGSHEKKNAWITNQLMPE